MTYTTPHTKRGKIRRLLSLCTAALLLATLSACTPPAPHEPTGATLPVEAEVNWELSWMSTPLANTEPFCVDVEREAFAIGNHILLNTCDTLMQVNPSVKAIAYDIKNETIMDFNHDGYLVGVSHTENESQLLFQDGTTFTMVYCDEKLKETEVKKVVFEDFPHQSIVTSWSKTTDGTQYIADTWGNTFKYDSENNLIAENQDTAIQHLMIIHDRLFGFSSWGEPTVYELNLNDLSATEVQIADMPHGLCNYGYLGNTDCFYINTQKQAIKIDPIEQKAEAVLDYDASDLASITTKAMPLADDRMFLIQATMSGCHFFLSRKRTEEEIANIQYISLATFHKNQELMEYVHRWNRQQTSYRIVVKAYEVFEGDSPTKEEWEKSEKEFQRFQAELLNGVIPDMFCLIDTNYLLLSNKGLFEDLRPYMENDPDFHKEDYFSNLFDGLAYRGRMERISFGFFIQTAVAKRSMLDGRTSIAISECDTMQLPEGMALYSPAVRKESLSSSLIMTRLQHFIDYDKQKCYFETDDFIKLLELSNKGLKDGGWDIDYLEWQEDRSLLYNAMLSSFVEYHDLNTANRTYDPVSLIGMPQSDRISGSSLAPDFSVAVSSNSLHKDIIWDFIKFSLAEQTNIIRERNEMLTLFPVNRIAFHEKFDWQKNFTREELGITPHLGEEFIFETPIDGEEEELITFIDQQTSVYVYDENLYNIVNEEIQMYFAGDCTAEDTAKKIQGRVKLYLGEQS